MKVLMEFDSEGRIILPRAIREDIERDSNSIVIERIQVSLKNPAVAQLRIRLGESLKQRVNEEDLIKEIYYFCKQFMERSWKYSEVQTKTDLFGKSVIVEARSSMRMYEFLNAVVGEMRELYVYNKGLKVSLKGNFGGLI